MGDHVQIVYDTASMNTYIRRVIEGIAFDTEQEAVRHLRIAYPQLDEAACYRYLRTLPAVQRTIGQPPRTTTDRDAIPHLLGQLGFLNTLTDWKSQKGVYRPRREAVYDGEYISIWAGTGGNGWGSPKDGEPFALFVSRVCRDGTEDLERVYSVSETK